MRRQGYLNVTLAPQNTVKDAEASASASSLFCLVDKWFNQNRVDPNVADSTKIQCDELLKSVSNEPEYLFLHFQLKLDPLPFCIYWIYLISDLKIYDLSVSFDL